MVAGWVIATHCTFSQSKAINNPHNNCRINSNTSSLTDACTQSAEVTNIVRNIMDADHLSIDNPYS